MIISIVGTGYVGLVTGAVLADFGNTVFCIDVDAKKIEGLKQSHIPFYEPELADIVHRNQKQGRLHFTTDYNQAIPSSEIVFICVGTPSLEDGSVDQAYVKAAVTEIAKTASNPLLIVIKSTSPIGIEQELKKIMDQHTEVKYEFASCPEFLKEGTAVYDTTHPDRIVIGTETKEAADKLAELYQPFGGERIICDIHSAQMVKYAANSFLALKISYANVISQLAEKVDADARIVLKGIGMDTRIGAKFLNPGIGYGGSCFPKDVAAFIDRAKQLGYDFELLKAIQHINQQQMDGYVEKVEDMVGDLNGKTLAALGLAFKPDTDDVREAPALKIIQILLEKGAKIQAYDPMATENAKKVLGDKVTYTEDVYQALDGADALLLMTEWSEFKELDFAKVKKLMKQPIIVDGRNIYDPAKMKEQGFTYQGIGKSV